MKLLFREKQRLNIFSLALSLSLFVLLLIYLYKQFNNEVSLSNNLVNNVGLTSLLVLVGILVLVSVFATQETIITDKGISLTFFPVLWSKRSIQWEDVENVYVREYNPLQEFGGWSIFRVNGPVQRGLGNNRAINVKGNKGLQLIMKDGSKLLIGTQKVEALESSLSEIKTA
jgi:hypothetical protein